MRERRKAPRYALGIEGTVNPPSGGAGTKVAVPVISTTGCSIECVGPANLGKKCELYFNWQDLQLGLQAQVVWKSEKGYGLKFYSVDEETQRRLNELCKALLIKPPSKTEASLEAPAVPVVKQLVPSGAKRELPSDHSGTPSRSTPPAVKITERRQVPRYVSELHAQLADLATGETLKVSLVTLSVLGGCLEGPAFPHVGAQCQLSAEWEGKRLAIEGEVVWKKRDQAGVKFRVIAEGSERLLRQICANLRLQPLAPMPPPPN